MIPLSDIETRQFVSAVAVDIPPAFLEVVSADVRPDGLVAVVLCLLNPGEASETPAVSLCYRSGDGWDELVQSAGEVDGVWEYSDTEWVATRSGCSSADRVAVRFGGRTTSVPVRNGWFQAVFWPESDGPPPSQEIEVLD